MCDTKGRRRQKSEFQMLYVEKYENRIFEKFVKINVEKENLLYESPGR